MPRILTVDDSRAIRSIVSKQMTESGFQVGEAEDGEKGLAALAQGGFDLVLLDVTMPVLDGPGMLARMRAAGDKTPVIMLTSESHSTVVAGAMKLGITDYILKPFKPDELRAKVAKVLKVPLSPVAAAPAPAAAPVAAVAAAPAASAAPGTPCDVLLIDDMENVAKKFRGMLPETLKMEGCTSGQLALNLCRERSFKVVIVDMVMPETNSVTLMKQLRALQPSSIFLALMLRTTAAAAEEATDEGFDGVVFKPFDADGIDELVHSHFGSQESLGISENVLTPPAFAGKEEGDRVERYFGRLRQSLETGIESVASACFDEVILDLSRLPLRPDRTPRLVLDVSQRAAKMGMELRLVGTLETARVLDTFTDTSAIPLYASIADAKSGGARLQRRGAA